MSRRRILRPEEEALWQAVARSAAPMHKTYVHMPVSNLPPALVPEPIALKAVSLPRFRVGEKARAVDLMPRPTAIPPIQMDRKAFDRLTRGKLAPEGRLDLHGMTVAEAHPELIRFILNASAEGVRLVLVITGKGKAGPDFGPIPQRYGVLKHQVPQWLRLPPLASAILQVSEAHLKHGGSGALYVYLRRGR